MKKVILYFAIASIICCNYSCDKENATDDNSAEELCARLERAFQLSSTSLMEQFLIDWNTSVSSNTVEQNDITKTIYEIYKEFYCPLDLTILDDWEWGNTLNSNSKYVVVQNKIYYAVIERELFDTWSWIENVERIDSINDFRPQLDFGENKVLYLLPEYEKALNMFLGTEENDNNLMRYMFLRPQIPILRGHWGWYWHLATHPEISLILLDTDKTVAKIHFRVGFQGGEATLEKNNNTWIITESRETWTE